MKKYFLIAVLLTAALAFCGCGKDDAQETPSSIAMPTAGPTMGPTMPGSPSTPSTPGIPGSPVPTMPSMPSLPTAPGMSGGTAAAAPAAPAAAPAADAASDTSSAAKIIPALPTLSHGDAVKDDNGEVRRYTAYPEYTAGKRSAKPFGADEKSCREAALAFVRAYYYDFDSMSFQYRDVPGVWKGDRWQYTFTQIIRETKRTGNTITIAVNPDYYDADNDMHYPEVVYYSSVKKIWTN